MIQRNTREYIFSIEITELTVTLYYTIFHLYVVVLEAMKGIHIHLLVLHMFLHMVLHMVRHIILHMVPIQRE